MASDVKGLRRIKGPSCWQEAQDHLMKRDRILRRLIPQFDAEGIEEPSTAFMTLVRSIIGQQVSRQSAQAIWGRFLERFNHAPEAQGVLETPFDELRKLGLSQRKTEYILGVAEYFADDEIRNLDWASLENERIIAQLCKLRGVGRWTAEMFLIFNLHRANVLPLDDAGLIKAISKHYFSGEPVSRFEAREVAQAWTPWCTVATWYLWRSLHSQSATR
ncbi:MAG TPA: DNA-3-methyladenine glycosylase 2 family protein [Paenalcaligenes sp.]|nr:DNA-3-methyladenine glycosylase 2 family protein [Paenalcaligenes sp.]HLR82461.1 DNA-3-methyladenine glycosylase 2 family protein [Paenalcaligenes sp.]